MRSNPLLPLPPTPPHTRVRKRDVNHATQAEAEAHVEGHTKTHPDTHAEAHTEAEAPPLPKAKLTVSRAQVCHPRGAKSKPTCF